jgi:polysaccharide pyruvyl transferase WcaK-like protein
LNEIKQINKNCLVVVGGGGLMQPVFIPFWEALIKSGLRYSLMGIGINFMKERASLDASLIKKIANSASWIGVRDEYTRESISSHMNNDNKVRLGVCPSVNFVANRYSEYSPEKQNKLLHLMHPSDLRFSGVDAKKISGNLKNIAASLNMQYEEHDNMSSNYKSSLNRIYQSRIVVTSRLHGCIISYAMGVPYIPLDCDKKIQAFLHTHDYSKKATPPIAFEESNRALELVKQGLDSKGSNKREVLKKIELNREYAEDIRNLIL